MASRAEPPRVTLKSDPRKGHYSEQVAFVSLPEVDSIISEVGSMLITLNTGTVAQ